MREDHKYDHPDLRIRELLSAVDGAYDRVVVAVDELDKRPARTISELVLQCRPLLDLPCSFVFSGKVLDVLRQVDSSAFGAFHVILDLEPFDQAGAREILLRNLALLRRHEETDKPFRPLEDDVVDRIVQDARGIPRVIHGIGFSLLEAAMSSAIDGDSCPMIGMPFYEECMPDFGAEMYAVSSNETRDLIREMRARGSYLSVDNLRDYVRDGVFFGDKQPLMENLVQNDVLVKSEAGMNVFYSLSPALEWYFASVEQWKAKLRQLWADVKADTQSANERGRSLESFAAELFAIVFKVAEQNLKNDTEELDLVLEYTGHDPIWARTPLAIVECKNWTARVPQKDVSVLATKSRLNTVELAFLISVSGYTSDARQQARDILMRDKVRLVLIEGSDVEKFLHGPETADDFLKRLCRQTELRNR